MSFPECVLLLINFSALRLCEGCGKHDCEVCESLANNFKHLERFMNISRLVEEVLQMETLKKKLFRHNILIYTKGVYCLDFSKIPNFIFFLSSISSSIVKIPYFAWGFKRQCKPHDILCDPSDGVPYHLSSLKLEQFLTARFPEINP
jgi:hypothetical protein